MGFGKMEKAACGVGFHSESGAGGVDGAVHQRSSDEVAAVDVQKHDSTCDRIESSGHRISADAVGRLLKANGYSLQGNRKRFEGQEWTPQGQPLEVEAYDFIDADRGKAIPYGIYDPSHNLGWVSVGTVQRTA